VRRADNLTVICELYFLTNYALFCSVNSDGLSALDVAVLSNNRQLAKMLVTFGAQEGNQCAY
jgi:ankyrin repeat protein